MSNSVFRIVGAGKTFLSPTDLYIKANTNDGGQVQIVLPNTRVLFENLNSSNTPYNYIGIRLMDVSNNASVNNIVIEGFENDKVNGQQTITLNINGSGGIFTLIGEGQWSYEANTISGSSIVQSVTGLNTNNTDPENPVIQISVDGTTIIGDGTPLSPLTAVENAVVQVGTGVGSSVRITSGNTASGNYTTTMGRNNTNSGDYGTISGGEDNCVLDNYGTISGGVFNKVTAIGGSVLGGARTHSCSTYGTIGGGLCNLIPNTGNYAFIGSGKENTASNYSNINGGKGNTASGSYTFIGGGDRNITSSDYAVVGGGQVNVASASFTTIGGGTNNVTSSCYASILGGSSNLSQAPFSSIGGGKFNTITGTGCWGTISGGYKNSVSGCMANIFAGFCNTATGNCSHISSGFCNVASSNFSTILGGFANTSSGYYAGVHGSQNIVSGNNSVISGGVDNIASSNGSAIGGGAGNTASNYFSNVSGGLCSTASGKYSTITGGVCGCARRYGQRSFTATTFGDTRGDAQNSEFVLSAFTNNNSFTEMFLDGASVSERITIQVGWVLYATINIGGYATDGSTGANYIRKVGIKNVGGTTSLVGAVSTIGTDVEDNPNYDVQITADNTNDSLKIEVKGDTGETLRWVAYVSAIETKNITA